MTDITPEAVAAKLAEVTVERNVWMLTAQLADQRSGGERARAEAAEAIRADMEGK